MRYEDSVGWVILASMMSKQELKSLINPGERISAAKERVVIYRLQTDVSRGRFPAENLI